MTEKAVFADISIPQICTTGGTQSRVELSEQAVASYAELMSEGTELPPIVVFHDGSTYWLGDGFHRVMAATRAGIEWLKSEVKKGTKRDAILYSVGSNSAHGLPRTNADKRRAVEMMLADEEWAKWSDREIGRRCVVAQSMVSKYRPILNSEFSIKDEKKFTHHKTGTETTMNTENIGKKSGKGHPGARQANVDRIRELAPSGMRASQIAEEVGLGETYVRELALKENIALADFQIGSSKRINYRRIIETAVLSLDASANSLQTTGYSLDEITKEEAMEWAESVAESLKIYRVFHKKLSEVANG
jgi:hypothetical protein